jgi:hypothetical protein
MVISSNERKESFVKKANLKHNNQYLYDSVVYKSCKEKVCITCKLHGEFMQTPDCHLSGNGCPKCGNINKQLKQAWTTERFIQEATNKHGDMYDYSRVIYVNANTPVIIGCKDHGWFEQIPYEHLVGSCRQCSYVVIASKIRRTKEEFINESKIKHLNKYDYSKVVYVSASTHVTIICPDHGEFQQVPNSHLQGMGCFKCGRVVTSEKTRSSKEQFTLKANKIHNNNYTYDNVIYINNHTPVIITCKKHGNFEQTPADHLASGGCIKCSKKSFSKEQIEWLKYIQVSHPSVEYVYNKGEHRVPETRYRLDGYIPKLKQALEFHGCYFHGCRSCYTEGDTINKLTKKTFKQLYNNTVNRKNTIIEKGYMYHELWQCKWKSAKNAVKKLQVIWRLRKSIPPSPPALQCPS